MGGETDINHTYFYFLLSFLFFIFLKRSTFWSKGGAGGATLGIDLGFVSYFSECIESEKQVVKLQS